ncbi:ImmA/IrrE family metallo-endopeptidase [Pseudoflavonifractor phocaeensis]|uniref:ImmA/IrrE family metallo-endopeptidase n=1 Tax=Pseudoflavonifractor phocaeensis TaxID=1870988 RepID=UPI00195D1542|nr:ImmA/IrrE family metallo-endopeptidase [Pseudoflavonifractor phocaeensis]MBM6724317.1 ImmA/IrrE family metallo-endopeptidase [Pseudoflavonifractor phocaeensis]
MSYGNYKNARDAAWKTLIECGISSLPVRPSEICRHYNWVLADYINGKQSIELLGLSELKEKTDGFCAVTENHIYIFYDSSLPVGRQRFTISHEIGHLMLGHVGPGTATIENREPTGTEREEETQANQFAARLLAPACVLHEVGATTAEEIRRLCGISMQAAEYRAKRMKDLEKRGRYYTSPLEREVIRQFHSYIRVIRRGR